MYLVLWLLNGGRVNLEKTLSDHLRLCMATSVDIREELKEVPTTRDNEGPMEIYTRLNSDPNGSRNGPTVVSV